ncbi:hypothetical protein ACFL2R_04050 [Patescibacteria group bacterium]
MKTEKLKNCWDYMKCSQEEQDQCDAFKYNMGKECWMIAGSYNKKPSCIAVKNGEDCIQCAWYKKINKK